MTPTEIETAARNRYNSIGDSFFSSEEILSLMWDACLDITRECNLIERTYTTSTVASQQEYSFPTSTITIKRITYDGKKLKPISMREDDAITGLNQSTTSEGTPQYYFIWNETIYLRPIPSSIATLKIFTYNEPSQILTSSTLEIPTQFHLDLVDYIVSEMAAKDSNFTAAKYYADKWERSKTDVKKWQKRRLRGDSFATVQDEDAMIEGYLGIV